MRDKNRLDGFYEELCKIHKKSFPDMRFFQFMLNVLGYIQAETKTDGWYLEEDKAIALIREYANKNSQWFREN